MNRSLPTRGFVYVSRADTGPMSNAASDRCVRIIGRAPPWLVVDHELASVVVARWPGRLWAVEVVEPIRAMDEKNTDLAPSPEDGAYTRAAAVKVLHELPVAALFGSRGVQVCAVIEAAASLTLEQAVDLADARHSGAGGAQTRVWKRWLDRETTWSRQHPEPLEDLDRTLAFAGLRPGSPVGGGLSVIDREVGRRAEAITGPSVWLFDEDRNERWLAKPWSTAGAALLDAALAFGTADLMQDEDANILAAAWRDVIGPDPA